MNDAKLGDFLAKLGVISPQQLYTAREAQAANGDRLASILVNMGFVSEEELARLAATALRLPYISLEKVVVPKDLIEKLPRDQARKAKGVLVKVDGKKFYLATCDPTNMQAFDEIQFVLNGRVMPVVASELEVIRAIGHYYGERVIPDRRFDLPQSTTVNFDKAEVFDIKGSRAQKLASEKKVDLAPSADMTNRKAAADKLSAAASQVKLAGAATDQPAPVAAARRSIELSDTPAAAPVKAAAPVAPKPAAPVAARPPVAPVPPKVAVVAAPAASADDDMPMIRDEQELVAPTVVHAGEAESDDLEVLELVEEDDDDAIVMGDAGDVDDEVLEVPDEPVMTPAAPPAAAEDFMSLFGAISFGAEPTAPISAEASAEADELAKLFMGALNGDGSTASPGADGQSQPVSDMAAELAHLLLDSADFSA